MKKLLALLLCLVMVASVFAGCGPVGPSKGTNGAEDDTTGGNVAATREPLPDDITLVIGIPEQAVVEDYDTNALTLWLEDETGYDIQFKKYMPLENDYKSKLSTALVDDEELPDILMNFNLGREYYQDLGEDGYLVDLAPFFEDETLAGDWWERFELLPEEAKFNIEKSLYDDEGRDNVWAFPTIDYAEYDTIAGQMYINQEWLKKLNLEMPSDPESLYTVLKAFKTQDPNGNGKPDEIPILGQVGGNWGDPVKWIINMFTYYDAHGWRVDENGELYTPYTTDEYREALIFINRLVKEGLMDSTCWSLDTSLLKGMLAPPDGVQKIGIVGGHPTLTFAVDDPGIYQYASVDYFGYAPLWSPNYNFRTFVTEDCEYPEAAWNVFMLLCTEEGSRRMRYGEKDVDWVEADEGAKSFLGYDADFKVLNENAYSGIGNKTWNVNVACLGIGNENEYCQLSEDMGEWVNYKMNMMADTYHKYMAAAERTPDNVVWEMVYSVEEDNEIDACRTNVANVYNVARASFCTGKSTDGKYTDPNNDAQWEAYKQEVLDQGYEEWREMAQAIYDDDMAAGHE